MAVLKTEKKCNLPGPGPGRPKGMTNKFTDLKTAFLDTFDRTGSIDGMVDWVEASMRNRGQFYQMIAKMLPSNVTADVKGTIDGTLKVEVIHLQGVDVPDGDNGNGNGNGNGNAGEAKE